MRERVRCATPPFVAKCLEEPHNAQVITLVKTAQAWGKAPSFLIGGQDEWRESDRILAIAYQMYLDGLCSECGMPRRVCRDPNRDGWVHADEQVCYVSKALKEKMQEKGYEPTPGTLLYPVLEEIPEGGGYGAPSWATDQK